MTRSQIAELLLLLLPAHKLYHSCVQAGMQDLAAHSESPPGQL